MAGTQSKGEMTGSLPRVGIWRGFGAPEILAHPKNWSPSSMCRALESTLTSTLSSTRIPSPNVKKALVFPSAQALAKYPSGATGFWMTPRS